MEAIEFVTAVRKNVIEDDLLYYRTALDNTIDATDPIWKEIIPVYRSLAKEQKESFLKFLRLVQVNAVSHLFGILDGSTFLSEKQESIVFTIGPDEDLINGDLQDIFLEMEE